MSYDHIERKNHNTLIVNQSFECVAKVVIPYLETVETNQNDIHKKLGMVEI
jgi:hypothetical protein